MQEPETDKNGDQPQEDQVLFVKIAWNKTQDQVRCESNITGRIDFIGLMGYAKRQMLAQMDYQQAQKAAQEQRIIGAMKLPMDGKGPA